MAEAKTGQGAAANRPLSPHIQIYRPTINMVMSIVHRITGAALYFGSLLLAWWLIAAAVGPAYFNEVNAMFATIPGKLVLFGYSWALIHHGLGGIRHFIWDTGAGYDLDRVDHMSWATLVGSVLLTAMLWLATIGQWWGQ
jgi:succinate dehydrogenase / fumarate reductase cytochrome b subunit